MVTKVCIAIDLLVRELIVYPGKGSSRGSLDIQGAIYASQRDRIDSCPSRRTGSSYNYNYECSTRYTITCRVWCCPPSYSVNASIVRPRYFRSFDGIRACCTDCRDGKYGIPKNRNRCCYACCILQFGASYRVPLDCEYQSTFVDYGN